MGILDFLSPKSVDTVVETTAKGVFHGLDKMVYTSEEKTQDKIQEERDHREWALKVLELTKDASPARSQIAIIVMHFWKIIVCNLLLLTNLKLAPVSEAVMLRVTTVQAEIVALIQMDYVTYPTVAVVSFYFLVKLKNVLAGDRKS